MQKHLPDDVLKLTVPAHKPIKRSTLSHILKQVRISVDEFLDKDPKRIGRENHEPGKENITFFDLAVIVPVCFLTLW